MRRPHVYERSAPRGSRGAYHEPLSAALAAVQELGAALPAMIAKAEAAGLAETADLLRRALAELPEQQDV